jgi:hypothetical protein
MRIPSYIREENWRLAQPVTMTTQHLTNQSMLGVIWRQQYDINAFAMFAACRFGLLSVANTYYSTSQIASLWAGLSVKVWVFPPPPPLYNYHLLAD